MTIEEYIRTVSIDHRKKYAQFFTPERISDFMASWLLDGNSGTENILEPAFGLGIFSKSLYKFNKQIKITGYEIDHTVGEYAKKGLKGTNIDVKLLLRDYLTASWTDKFDGIICNPPYLKFYDYDNATLVPMENGKLNIHLNGFTNLYTLFLLKSIYQLKEDGRLAYIIPSEFLNSDYGVEVKRELLHSGVLKHIIIVDFTQNAFNDAITTACIILCQKGTNSESVRFSYVSDISHLKSSLNNYKAIPSCQLNPEVKWKQYYEETHASKYNHLVPFSTFAKVSRGIATGDNKYFTFNYSKIDAFQIPENCFLRCICHAANVQNRIFTNDDFQKLANHDKTVFLFNGCANENEQHVKSYIKFGEDKEVNKKYLTASRNPWYALEKRLPSPIWVSVFNRNGLRFVRNKAGAYNLTTFHCVYNTGVIDTDILFAYLITDVAKEIFLDNARQYGNGLVKFEPNDLNKGNAVDLRLLTTEEKNFICKASTNLQYYGSIASQTTLLLNDFFKSKYSDLPIDLHYFKNCLNNIATNKVRCDKIEIKTQRTRQLSLIDTINKYKEGD